ncbi:MAG: ribosome biogenesis factor YjgA [Methyloprofundus sp.]|nr:ribosome biogenesis factor YjgA [Methyloprofundus sp.]
MSEFIEEDWEEETWAIRPNKSQLKRDIAEISSLSEEISQLTAAQIEKFSLPDAVVVALEAAAKMPAKSARKRQMKYVTSLMRNEDLDAIQETLDKMKAKSAHAARELHQAERWRDRLLSEDTQALTDLLNQFPSAEAQQVRQLMRNAKKEASLSKPPKNSRLLFRYLRELIEATPEH